MIYNIEYETMPREALEAIQLRRLQATLERVYASVPFYQKKFAEAGITPADIRSLEDLRHVPFTTKQDLRGQLPIRHVRRAHGQRGPDSRIFWHHRAAHGGRAIPSVTWAHGAELMARALSAGGANRGDIIHNAYGYGLFTGGLGVHYGAEKLGASVIPVSGGNTKRQVVIMRDFGPTIITATPSYTLHLAEVAEEMGIAFDQLNFKFGIFGGRTLV